MSAPMPELEPLSEAAESLLDAERASTGGPAPDVAARVLARVQATLAAAPPAAEPASASEALDGAGGPEATGPAAAAPGLVAPAPPTGAPPTPGPGLDTSAGTAGGVSTGITAGIVIGLVAVGASFLVAPPLTDYEARTVPGVEVEADQSSRESPKAAPTPPAASAPAAPPGASRDGRSGPVPTPVAPGAVRVPVRRLAPALAAPGAAGASGAVQARQPAASTEAPGATDAAPPGPEPGAATGQAAVPGDASQDRADEAGGDPGLPPREAKPGRPRDHQDLAAERIILEAARSELARGQAGAALKSVREHRDQWPLGALAEEREALWVRALVAVGMGEAAQRRGERFMRRYPGSIHRAAVESALDAL